MKCTYALILPVIIMTLVAGCQPGKPSEGADDDNYDVTGFADELSQREFAALPAAQQYLVANKLLGTFYRGVAVDEFFDLSAGIDALSVQQSDFINQTRAALDRDLPDSTVAAVDQAIFGLDSQGNADEEQARYSFDGDTDADDTDRPKQEPLARITDLPLSRNLMAQWMAYFLTNTILFSPALEMESTNSVDAANTFITLHDKILAGETVQQIVRGHLNTVARWRVSRSAENHALEAYELYLGLFETAEDSRKGGIACKNYYLTDESDGYQLSLTGQPNTQNLVVLDNYFITTCDDLYNVIVSHPLFMPRIIEVITNYLMADRSLADRLAMVESILDNGAQTFEDIFTTLLFSKQYLLHTERPQLFEENLLGFLHRAHWSVQRNSGEVGRGLFQRMTDANFSGSLLYQRDMGLASMEYKIGRVPNVPMDALSFANVHKAMREAVLLNNGAWQGGAYSDTGFRGLFYDFEANPDAPDSYRSIVRDDIRALSAQEFIDLLFLTAIQRKANASERRALTNLVDELGLLQSDETNPERLQVRDFRQDDVSARVFEYISRLPEFYYFKAVN